MSNQHGNIDSLNPDFPWEKNPFAVAISHIKLTKESDKPIQTTLIF